MGDPTEVPELSLSVGSMITIRPDEDREAYEESRDSVAEVQDFLREQGIEVDLLSQPGAELWEGSIEAIGALYQLSRLAAYLEQGRDIKEVLEDGPVISDDLDPVVTDVWDELTTTRFPHLINLQGQDSYYLPADFELPIWLPFINDDDEEDSAYFGSAVRLQRELADLDGLLRAARVPGRSEAYQALETLRTAADQSLRYGLPIIVW